MLMPRSERLFIIKKMGINRPMRHTNRNVPNMIGQLSHVLGVAGLNIAQMHNASRGELAYTLVDVEGEVPEQLTSEIAAIPGILSVRVV